MPPEPQPLRRPKGYSLTRRALRIRIAAQISLSVERLLFNHTSSRYSRQPAQDRRLADSPMAGLFVRVATHSCFRSGHHVLWWALAAHSALAGRRQVKV